MRPDKPWGAPGKDGPDGPDGPDGHRSPKEGTKRPTLNTAVRRRRADRAFYLRLAGAIRQNTRALERLRQ